MLRTQRSAQRERNECQRTSIHAGCSATAMQRLLVRSLLRVALLTERNGATIRRGGIQSREGLMVGVRHADCGC